MRTQFSELLNCAYRLLFGRHAGLVLMGFVDVYVLTKITLASLVSLRPLRGHRRYVKEFRRATLLPVTSSCRKLVTITQGYVTKVADSAGVPRDCYGNYQYRS